MEDFPYPLPMLLDGATGTALEAAGMPADIYRPGGSGAEQWILQHPDALRSLQNAYIDAGSQAVLAPTFGANASLLAAYGLEGRVAELNTELVHLTQSIAKPRGVLVGGSICPSGLFVPPYGEADFDDIYDLYRQQIRALDKAGVDFIAIESQTSLADMRAAVLAARTTDLPVFVTIAVDESGHTVTGSSLLPVVITLQAMGVDAIGLNCLLDPMLPLIEEVCLHTAVPIIAKPDVRSSDETLLTPESFAQKMRLLMQAGARIVGGHDDSTPEHIAALKEVVQEFGEPEIPEEPDCYAATIETEAFFLGDDIAFSEPLACTSHLADDLIDLEDDRCNTALVEVESLDDALLLAENSGMTRLPIAVHCDSAPVLDAALRYFQGRLIVDSECQIEDEVLEPLAAKYGAILY